MNKAILSSFGILILITIICVSCSERKPLVVGEYGRAETTKASIITAKQFIKNNDYENAAIAVVSETLFANYDVVSPAILEAGPGRQCGCRRHCLF